MDMVEESLAMKWKLTLWFNFVRSFRFMPSPLKTDEFLKLKSTVKP